MGQDDEFLSDEDMEFLETIGNDTPEKQSHILSWTTEKIKIIDLLLLDVLNQSCSIIKEHSKDYFIDNQCLSAYEDACDYLENKGYLKKINSRIYQIKK